MGSNVIARSQWNPATLGSAAAVSLILLLSGCGGAAKTVSSPWGREPYRAGLVQDESALRSALGWGRTHARTAAQTLAAYYETTRRTGKHVQRVRVQTRWSRLALHAAKRMRSSLEPDPATVERILNGPPLTITLVMRGFHKGLVSKLDMVLVQGSHRVYAPTLERRDPRPIKEDGRIVAYEGELKGDFPPDALNPRKSATLEVRRENGSYFYVDIPLWRFK